MKRNKRDAAAVLAEQAPQQMREALAPHVQEYCDELLWDMRNRGTPEEPNPSHRTAMSLIPQILKAVGAQNILVLNLWQRIGVQSEDQARRLINAAMDAQVADEESLERQCLEFIQSRRAERGQPLLLDPAKEAR